MCAGPFDVRELDSHGERLCTGIAIQLADVAGDHGAARQHQLAVLPDVLNHAPTQRIAYRSGLRNDGGLQLDRDQQASRKIHFARGLGALRKTGGRRIEANRRFTPVLAAVGEFDDIAARLAGEMRHREFGAFWQQRGAGADARARIVRLEHRLLEAQAVRHSLAVHVEPHQVQRERIEPKRALGGHYL
ncbi:MAG: hypothetical protein ABSC93_15635 [Bryobacteraceae bacterium]